MPSRILLISANRCTAPDPVFPLALAHLNAALREAGHRTFWLDTLADADRFDAILGASEPDYVGISLRNIDDVLIRKQETFFDNLASLCARIRQHTSSPIILGGSGFSLFPERLLALAGADFGICGEGEASLVALINALESDSGLSAIPGLVYRQNGNIMVNAPSTHSLGHDLADEDRPAPIRQHYLQASGILNLQTQRGCGCRCCYCTYPVIEGKQQRRRPAEAVAAEFEQLQRLGARYVFIVDSIFNSSPLHVTEVCEAILRRNVKLAWGCFMRPRGLTPELIRLMAQAGLTHIEFGTDSFSDTTLSAYHKHFTFEDVFISSELARQRQGHQRGLRQHQHVPRGRHRFDENALDGLRQRRSFARVNDSVYLEGLRQPLVFSLLTHLPL